MREFNLFAQIPRAYRVTTQSKHKHRRFKNELKKIKIRRSDQAWGVDITYLHMNGRFIYLAVVIDLYSRKVVGWAVGPSINQELTLTALKDAIKKRKPKPGCIHHSDQGVQYCAEDYINLLKHNKFTISMSRTGNPYENSLVERFMKTIKYEKIYLNHYLNFADAVKEIAAFIEDYNNNRPHSSLGYLPPAKYEQLNRAGQQGRTLV